jgi:hypothetical protein
MADSAWMITTGVLMATWALWWLPWQMRRVRAREARRGRGEHFDAVVLNSRVYRFVVRATLLLAAMLITSGCTRLFV